MRLAILSDIHGNLPALQAVITDLEHRQVNQVVNLGDHASGPLWPRETVEFLMRQPWTQIAGNHERQLTRNDPASHGASDHYAFTQLTAEQLHWLRELPASARIGEAILLFHGTPADDRVYLLESIAHGQVQLATQGEISLRLGNDRAKIMLCGHSHLPRLVHTLNGDLIVNPGSVGVQGYTDDGPQPHLVQLGSPEARYAILEQRGASWQVEFHVIPYDHRAAAEQAQRNGRADWESVLRTGCVRQ